LDHTFEQAIADGHIVIRADVVISDGTSVVATLQNVSPPAYANDFLFI
jgi:hypothetical protein